MSNWGWRPTFEIQAQGHASPEAQIEYLIKCLKVSQDKVATLQLELETLRIERNLDKVQFQREVDGLIKARQRVLRNEQKSFLPWWKRIFRR